MTATRRAARTKLGSTAGVAIEVLVWTLAAWGVWLLSLSAVDVPDLLVGGLSALACGFAAAGVRRAIGARWHPTAGAARPARLLPIAIVVDSAAVLLAPWRRRRATTIVRVDIGAKGQSPSAAARRAIATAVVSATPSSVVLDADGASGILTLHTMRSPGPAVHERYAAK